MGVGGCVGDWVGVNGGGAQFLKGNPSENEKCENLNFGENLQIWLEILNKKNLKFWLQTIT